MSGPTEIIDAMWVKLAEVLKFEDPGPMGLYLGCIHEEGTTQIDDKQIKTITFNQEEFFKDKIEKYIDLCMEKGSKTVKLHRCNYAIRQRNREGKLCSTTRTPGRGSSNV